MPLAISCRCQRVSLHSARGARTVRLGLLHCRSVALRCASLCRQRFCARRRPPTRRTSTCTFLAALRTETHALLFADIVLNHTADNSPWLAEQPDAAYNTRNSPHLRVAYELDCAMLEFSAALERERRNVVRSHADVDALVAEFFDRVLPASPRRQTASTMRSAPRSPTTCASRATTSRVASPTCASTSTARATATLACSSRWSSRTLRRWRRRRLGDDRPRAQRLDVGRVGRRRLCRAAESRLHSARRHYLERLDQAALRRARRPTRRGSGRTWSSTCGAPRATSTACASTTATTRRCTSPSTLSTWRAPSGPTFSSSPSSSPAASAPTRSGARASA
jgi:hypothetical protein